MSGAGANEPIASPEDDPLFMVNAQLLNAVNASEGAKRNKAVLDAAAVLTHKEGVITAVLASNAHIDQYDGVSLRGYALAIDPAIPFDSALHPGPLVGCTAVFSLGPISAENREALNKVLRDSDLPAQLSVSGVAEAGTWTDNGGTSDRIVVMEPFPCTQQAVAESQFPGDVPDVSASMVNMADALLYIRAHVPAVDQYIRSRASTEGWGDTALSYVDMIRKSDIFKYAYSKTLTEVRRIAKTVIDDAAGYLHLSGASSSDPEPVGVWWSDTISITTEPLRSFGARAAVYYCDTYAGAVTAHGAGKSGWMYALSPSQGAVWLRGPKSATASTMGYGRITSNPNALDMLVTGAPPLDFVEHAPVLDKDAHPHWPGISASALERVRATVHGSADYPLLEAALPLPREAVDVHTSGAQLTFSKLGHNTADGHVHMRTIAAVLSLPPSSSTSPSNYEYALTHSEAAEFSVPMTRELVNGMLEMHGLTVKASGMWFGTSGMAKYLATPDKKKYEKLGPNDKAVFGEYIALQHGEGKVTDEKAKAASAILLDSVNMGKYKGMPPKVKVRMAKFLAFAEDMNIVGNVYSVAEHTTTLAKSGAGQPAEDMYTDASGTWYLQKTKMDYVKNPSRAKYEKLDPNDMAELAMFISELFENINNDHASKEVNAVTIAEAARYMFRSTPSTRYITTMTNDSLAMMAIFFVVMQNVGGDIATTYNPNRAGPDPIKVAADTIQVEATNRAALEAHLLGLRINWRDPGSVWRIIMFKYKGRAKLDAYNVLLGKWSAVAYAHTQKRVGPDASGAAADGTYDVDPSGTWWRGEKGKMDFVRKSKIPEYKKLSPKDTAELAYYIATVSTTQQLADSIIINAAGYMIDSDPRTKYAKMKSPKVGAQMAYFIAAYSMQGVITKDYVPPTDLTRLRGGAAALAKAMITGKKKLSVILMDVPLFQGEKGAEMVAAFVELALAGGLVESGVAIPANLDVSMGPSLSTMFAGENTADGTITLSRAVLATLVQGGHVTAH